MNLRLREDQLSKLFIAAWMEKMKGQGAIPPPRVRTSYIFWSWVGAFTGIFCVAFVTYRAGVPMMIGSFGASAVLIYAAIEGPLSQPRNLIGGHVISATLAVGIYKLFGNTEFSLALAVSGAIVAMLATRTLHPPGGATALIAVNTQQSWTFIAYPVLGGALILLAVALMVNNLSGERHYPKNWI
ncbi:MAG: HPP family protein [Nitrospinae bacterium]|nr:HPP family protein [Nitrospinota bacterium]